MTALNLFNVIPQCSTCTMSAIFTDELFVGFEILCSTYRALVCVGRVWMSCAIDSVSMLCSKYWCMRHFLESDFTTVESVHLNRLAIPCGPDSSVQYGTGEDEYIYIYIRFSVFITFLFKILYYFCHIILFSTELENMSMFQDLKVCHSSAIILFLFKY
jgi:hypothetical protein